MQFWEYVQRHDFKKKLITQVGKYKVFRVDGEAIRNSSKDNEEFGEVCIHNDFPKLIPDNEIWVEDDVKEKEIPVLIDGALCELKNLAAGVSPKKAYDLGLQKQRDESNCSKAFQAWESNKPASKAIYKKEYGTIEGVKVLYIDGAKVRKLYKSDFMEGGHGYVYKFVPDNEIWIEDGIHEKEVPYVLLHEFVERTLMKRNKMKYDKAHNIAAKVEYDHRGKFSKASALSLTENKALALAGKH